MPNVAYAVNLKNSIDRVSEPEYSLAYGLCTHTQYRFRKVDDVFEWCWQMTRASESRISRKDIIERPAHETGFVVSNFVYFHSTVFSAPKLASPRSFGSARLGQQKPVELNRLKNRPLALKVGIVVRIYTYVSIVRVIYIDRRIDTISLYINVYTCACYCIIFADYGARGAGAKGELNDCPEYSTAYCRRR